MTMPLLSIRLPYDMGRDDLLNLYDGSVRGAYRTLSAWRREGRVGDDTAVYTAYEGGEVAKLLTTLGVLLPHLAGDAAAHQDAEWAMFGTEGPPHFHPVEQICRCAGPEGLVVVLLVSRGIVRPGRVR
jgi:hypothetical protein